MPYQQKHKSENTSLKSTRNIGEVRQRRSPQMHSLSSGTITHFQQVPIYSSPSRENRGASQFVSSFPKKDKPAAPIKFTSGFDTGTQRTK
ncbi:hypothetical protein OSTOST_14760 [Ostertagia ostertagi]